ncbi:2-oxoglutarate and iron-dependent oxygenase domain-containing protein, partial [Klebsiella pneumoniae]|uniref:2-oxoglutarate and iron-dependent oxygenase domain-containing protein n=1 Tax=Klebsiella pneumoniae TaxID=573 RepID=UPI003012A482
TGFFALQNHGVDSRLIEKAYQLSEAFFDLPVATKRSTRTFPSKASGVSRPSDASRPRAPRFRTSRNSGTSDASYRSAIR